MAVLAVNGGKQAVDKKLIQKWPPVGQAQYDAVREVLDSGVFWGPTEKQVELLQEEARDYLGVKYSIVVNSGTAALHACHMGVGTQPGDEVICTAFSFWASCQGVVAQNAIPVFVDVDPNTFNIDPTKIEAKITDRTTAIVPVHTHGTPCDMDAINAIAKKYNLKVIEDAAQSFGATYKGKKGVWGDMAAISLNGTKNLPGGEGGIVLTDNEEYYQHARMGSMFGEKHLKKGEYRLYDALQMGFNYRSTELNDALCRSYLHMYDEMQEQRLKNVAYLHEHLSGLKGIKPLIPPEWAGSTYHLYKVLWQPEELGVKDISVQRFKWAAERALCAEGCDCYTWHIMPIPGERIFQSKNAAFGGIPWSLSTTSEHSRNIVYDPYDYPVAMDMFDRSMILRCIYYPNTVELMEQLVEAVKKVLANVDELVEYAKTIEFPRMPWEKRIL